MVEKHEDKRRFKRFEFNVDAAYKLQGGESKEGKGITGDISREGIKFFTNEEVAKGTTVDLSFNIPGDDQAIKATGEVMWCISTQDTPAPFSVGIKLLNIDPADKFKILDYAYHNWLRNEFGDVSVED